MKGLSVSNEDSLQVWCVNVRQCKKKIITANNGKCKKYNIFLNHLFSKAKDSDKTLKSTQEANTNIKIVDCCKWDINLAYEVPWDFIS